MRNGMKVLGLMTSAISTSLLAQVPPPPRPVLPMPHAGPSALAGAVPPPPPLRQMLVGWRAEAARCHGRALFAVRPPNPLPGLGWSMAGADRPIRFTFRTDAQGRPMGIKADPNGFSSEGRDLGPSLAASRFAPGARTDCSITFEPVRQPIEAAPVELAMAYTVFPTSSIRPAALWERIRPAGSTCVQPRLQVLNRAFPDFPALPGEQGRPLWSMVAFDVDRAGKPVNVRTAEGSRSADLDAASRRAISQSRFGRAARRGCLYPYWKAADPLPAPEMPARESFPQAGVNCTEKGGWARQPTLIYPSDYRRRGIEGWAVIAYDVAPWGEIGNARVLAAEPSMEFGSAGLNSLPSGTKLAGQGATGCIERFRFVMRKPGEAAQDASEEAAY